MCGNDLENSPLSVVLQAGMDLRLWAARSPCSRAGSVVSLKQAEEKSSSLSSRSKPLPDVSATLGWACGG